MKNNDGFWPAILLVCGVVLAVGIIGRIEIRQPEPVEQANAIEQLEPDNGSDRSFEKKIALMRHVLKQNPSLDTDDALVIAAAIVDACEQYDLDIDIVCAILQTESGFRPAVVGSINRQDRGIGQINLKYWQRHLTEAGLIRSADDLMQPHYNIRAAAYILRHYLDRHGDIEKAIIAYNGREDYLPKVKNNL